MVKTDDTDDSCVRARFIARFANAYGNDPAVSSQLQRACEDEAALAQIRQALVSNGAADNMRLEAQRAVYLAMVRLHVELDQCFMFAMNSLEQGRALFPDLLDRTLSFLARDRGARTR